MNQQMMLNANLNPWPVQKRKINREVIEWDLRTYQAMKKEVEEVLMEIDEMAAPSAVDYQSNIYCTARQSGFKSRQPGDRPEYMKSRTTRNTGDPTASQAEAIWEYREAVLGGTEYREMVRRINAIERVMARLEQSQITDDQLKAKLIRMKYFAQNNTDQSIRLKLDISERTFYRWQSQVINEIAKYLGFIL